MRQKEKPTQKAAQHMHTHVNTEEEASVFHAIDEQQNERKERQNERSFAVGEKEGTQETNYYSKGKDEEREEHDNQTPMMKVEGIFSFFFS